MHLYEFQDYLINGGFENKDPSELILEDLSLVRTINDFTAEVNILFSEKEEQKYSYSEFAYYCSNNTKDYKKNDNKYFLINNIDNIPSFDYFYEITPTPPTEFNIVQNNDSQITVDGTTYSVNNDGIAMVKKIIINTTENNSEEIWYTITCFKKTRLVYTKTFSECKIKYTNIYNEEKEDDVNYDNYNNIFDFLFANNLVQGINTKENNLPNNKYTYTEEAFNKKNRTLSTKIHQEPISGIDSIESAYDLKKFTLKTDLPDNFFSTTGNGNISILVDYSKININNRITNRIRVKKIVASTNLRAIINEDTKVPSQDYMNFLEERIKNLENELSNTKTELNNYKLNPILPIGKPANATNGSIWIS